MTYGLKQACVLAAAVAAIVSLVACGGASVNPRFASSGPSAAFRLAAPLTPEEGSYRSICRGEALLPGHSHCTAILRVDSGARAFDAGHVNCNGTQPGCYGPQALDKAYGVSALAQSGGAGMTVAVVDAFGYPGVQSDLAKYRSTFGMPACGSGCIMVVNQEGKTTGLPPVGPSSDDWRGEQALDIDMVSALCWKCHIILVQAKNDETANLAAGVDTAVKLGANVISNSYACSEGLSGCTNATNAHYNHPGHVITASADDIGAGAVQPCSLATVFCIGGTSLNPAAGARGYSEVVWNDLAKGDGATGSGCSSVVRKPAWQNDRGCAWRSESDLSADADPLTGVVLSCTPCGGLLVYGGGTSASSPMVAAMFALAGNAKTETPAKLWAHQGKGFNDVTQGTNEKSGKTFVCPASYSYICIARKGYDGPTGWGTPNGVGSL
jgi:Subtilase family